jgi:hypothetical protein
LPSGADLTSAKGLLANSAGERQFPIFLKIPQLLLRRDSERSQNVFSREGELIGTRAVKELPG